MTITIIRPSDTSTFEASWFEIQTPQGSYIIQRDHAPMVVSLSPQKPIHIKLKNGKSEIIGVRTGIVHITRDGATIMLQA